MELLDTGQWPLLSTPGPQDVGLADCCATRWLKEVVFLRTLFFWGHTAYGISSENDLHWRKEKKQYGSTQCFDLLGFFPEGIVFTCLEHVAFTCAVAGPRGASLSARGVQRVLWCLFKCRLRSAAQIYLARI